MFVLMNFALNNSKKKIMKLKQTTVKKYKIQQLF